mmetsp:Transcript_28495/g.86016  ORF Transcript_28495/g.86016 Transcript_28495/m.86016 type:complete len:202 (-) Transcript_28495:277-882(-)
MRRLQRVAALVQDVLRALLLGLRVRGERHRRPPRALPSGARRAARLVQQPGARAGPAPGRGRQDLQEHGAPRRRDFRHRPQVADLVVHDGGQGGLRRGRRLLPRLHLPLPDAVRAARVHLVGGEGRRHGAAPLVAAEGQSHAGAVPAGAFGRRHLLGLLLRDVQRHSGGGRRDHGGAADDHHDHDDRPPGRLRQLRGPRER